MSTTFCRPWFIILSSMFLPAPSGDLDGAMSSSAEQHGWKATMAPHRIGSRVSGHSEHGGPFEPHSHGHQEAIQGFEGWLRDIKSIRIPTQWDSECPAPDMSWKQRRPQHFFLSLRFLDRCFHSSSVYPAWPTPPLWCQASKSQDSINVIGSVLTLGPMMCTFFS